MRRAENSTRCYIRICQLVLARMIQGSGKTPPSNTTGCQLTLARMMQGGATQEGEYHPHCQLTLARMMQGVNDPNVTQYWQLSTYPRTHDARANHGLITYVLHFLPHVRVRRLYGLLSTGLSSLPKRQRTLSRVALRHAMCRITGTNSAYGVTVRRKSQCEHRASAMKASASHRIIFVLSSPG